MLARAHAYALTGLEVTPIEIEVDAASGLPGLTIVGLPDQAVKEARERIRSAILNSQFQLPHVRLTVNLAPADVRKQGGLFDLPIALGVLAATGQLDPARLDAVKAVGELALDGSVRPGRGILPMAVAARREGSRRLVVPAANAPEAALVGGLDVLAVHRLDQAVAYLEGHGERVPLHLGRRTLGRPVNRDEMDFAEVKGQLYVKRGLEVAVAGGHHVLLIGPPGAGKSMLAQRIPTIQPALALEEALETTMIHSVAGLLDGQPLIDQRPFRSPHSTSSAVSLIGGGPTLRPGEVSLAHHGVLFLDELPEFTRDVLESLRQPLEEGVVSVARAKRAVRFPARFMLVAAMNPCPDGFLTDPSRRCRCSSTQIQRYLSKISGPLLDRIDLHIDVPAVPFDSLSHAPEGESSAQIRTRVQRAVAFRRKRGQSHPNAQLHSKEFKTFCEMTPQVINLLKSAMQELNLSARSYTKILKISRTIADLAGSEMIKPEHVAEAIQYRSLDRQLWT